MSSEQKLITIVGPTASGKSELAVFLAKEIIKHKWNGFQRAEIISADSRQVYKYLNIGTNKVPGKWQKIQKNKMFCLAAIAAKQNIFIYRDIPHHCIDFVHPKHTFTVAEYKKCANNAMQDIYARGTIPILAGGTGFYIQAIVDTIAIPEVPPNQKLRKELEKKSIEELFAMLKKLDSRRAASIDSKNPRRLIRAIEIVKTTEKPVPLLPVQTYPISAIAKMEYGRRDILIIGIRRDPQEHKKRVEQMVRRMIKDGLLAETKMLLEKLHLPKKRIRELGFEYHLALDTISRSPTSALLRKLEKELVKENWRYVKRQMTWFKRDKRIRWTNAKKDALGLVRAFLQT